MPKWWGATEGGGGEGGGGSGDVVGPASSTDGNVAAFDGTTGKLLEDSGVAVASLGDVDGPASATDKALPSFNGTGGKTLQATSVTLTNTTGVFTQTTANGSITLTPNGTGKIGLGTAALVKLSISDQTFFSLSGVELRNAADNALLSWAVKDLLIGAPATDGVAPHVAFRGSSDDVWFGSNFALYWSDTPTQAINRVTGLLSPATAVLRITAGTSGIGALEASREVEANTAGSGAPNVLAATESRKLLTNEGAGATENYETLPSAASGIEFDGYARDSGGQRYTAQAGDEIEVLGTVSATGGFVRLAQNAKCRFTAINATRWGVFYPSGTITVDA